MLYGKGQSVTVKHFHRKGERIVCDVCPVKCTLSEGQRGVCRGRRVINGTLIAENYGQVVSMHLDPIEKKPLYHFMPGSMILSAGANGCNFHCRWCQNCEISQMDVRTTFIPPRELARKAMNQGSVGLAYTYSEPLIWHETLLETMPIVRDHGGVNVFVTNGYAEKEPLEELLPYLDAANVDLKFMDAGYYRKHTGGKLEIVQRTIQHLVEVGVHVEITHLLVTGLSDNLEKVGELASWIADIDRHIPLHLSRYYPRHEWDQAPTPVSLLERATHVAREHLDYVFPGNVNLPGESDTHCPHCDAVMIHRDGWRIQMDGIDKNGFCRFCSEHSGLIM